MRTNGFRIDEESRVCSENNDEQMGNTSVPFLGKRATSLRNLERMRFCLYSLNSFTHKKACDEDRTVKSFWKYNTEVFCKGRTKLE